LPSRELRASAGLAALTADRDRKRRTLEHAALLRCAACHGQPGMVRLHRRILAHPVQRLPQDLRGPDMRRHDDAVVHPLALAPRRHNPGTPQVRQKPRDLGLRLAQDLDEVADADLLIPHQVQEAQPRVVTQRLEKPLYVEGRLPRHAAIIYALTHVLSRDTFALTHFSGGAMPQRIPASAPDQLIDAVKQKYGAVASSSLSSDHEGVKAVAEAFGYTPEELHSIPAEANMGLSCGNPTATARLKAGEVVVDLGSGGGA